MIKSNNQIPPETVEPNIKYKKNYIDPGWPGYMVNKFQFRSRALQVREKQKLQITNSKYGMSADNPANSQHAQSQVYINSSSLFGLNPNYQNSNIQTKDDFKDKDDKKVNLNAGLVYNNQQHKFHYFNGKKEAPSIFTNFIKNAHLKPQPSRTKSAVVNRYKE